MLPLRPVPVATLSLAIALAACADAPTLPSQTRGGPNTALGSNAERDRATGGPLPLPHARGGVERRGDRHRSLDGNDVPHRAATHYESLDGIVWSPWGTIPFAEERGIASFRDPLVRNAVGGLVYEYDPRTGATRPRPAIGARSHEGLRFDTEGNLYGIPESTPGVNGSGAIYKFVPDVKGDLSSGQLYAREVLAPSRTGAAVWVPLDRQAVQANSDAAVAAGATGWGRPEDVELTTGTGNDRGGPNVAYLTSTSEKLVLRIALRGNEATETNYVVGASVSGFQDPDDLALDPQGNLCILEDNGPGDIWVARPGRGGTDTPSEVVRFASLAGRKPRGAADESPRRRTRAYRPRSRGARPAKYSPSRR
jgi:hypothetical protein